MHIYCPRCGEAVRSEETLTCRSCGAPRPHSGIWPTDPLLGQVIDGGKYLVERLVGRGGFGRVYRVQHTMLPDQHFALKVLRPLDMNSENPEEGFLREVRVLMNLNHPNIVQCHDVGRLPDGSLFLRMEYVEGRGLHKLVKKPDRVLAPRRAAHIGTQIAAALAAAHKQRVLHRDLKPDNVLVLANNDEVRLIDFGIAKVLGSSDTQQHLSRVIGTPDFMAPEQFTPGKRVSERLDVFQLGAVMHFALTGSAPYSLPKADNLQQSVIELYQLQMSHKGRGGPRPSLRLPGLEADAPALDVLISRMLSTEPESRPLADEASDALAAIARGEQPSMGPRIVPLSQAIITAHHDTPQLAMVETAYIPAMISAQDKAPTVAVLTFENRGPETDDYLVEGLAEDLTDLLSVTEGIRVRASGLIRHVCKGCQDPLATAEALQVDHLVVGSLRRHPGGLTVRARLISGEDGAQLWGKRLETDAAGLMGAAEDLGEAILTVLEVKSTPQRVMAPNADAADLYLRARHELRKSWQGDVSVAMALFDQALAAAPLDPLVMAWAAIAKARYIFHANESLPGLMSEARHLATKALDAAPQRVEPRVALAMVDFFSGLVHRAVAHLRQTLLISNTYAEAHDLLGRILIETGPLEEGMDHLRRALALDPGLYNARFDLARGYALVGQWDKSDALLDLPLASETDQNIIRFYRSRYALWQNRPVEALVPASKYEDVTITTAMQILTEVRATRQIPENLKLTMLTHLATVDNPRRRSVMTQFSAEVAAWCREWDDCFQSLELARSAGLVDLVWLDMCPLFDEIRDAARFRAVRDQVSFSLERQRASV